MGVGSGSRRGETDGAGKQGEDGCASWCAEGGGRHSPRVRPPGGLCARGHTCAHVRSVCVCVSMFTVGSEARVCFMWRGSPSGAGVPSPPGGVRESKAPEYLR